MIGSSNACVISGNTDFGHTIDFISDGAQYAKYMITDGQSVAAPSDPTKSGHHLVGWLDDGTAVTFPYTPTGDVTLAAEFVAARDGMVLTTAGSLICTLNNRAYTKTYDGASICGYFVMGGYTYPVLVGKTPNSAIYTCSEGTYEGSGNILYNGITYYYSVGAYGRNGNYNSSATDVADLYKFTATSDVNSAQKLLDRYFYVT